MKNEYIDNIVYTDDGHKYIVTKPTYNGFLLRCLGDIFLIIITGGVWIIFMVIRGLLRRGREKRRHRRHR
ncbi:MAG: hypothetical protein FWG21_05480 [Oscillospiraceae bacterium]|nr:hypothetical protein [Oscillospiraceae bacterium]